MDDYKKETVDNIFYWRETKKTNYGLDKILHKVVMNDKLSHVPISIYWKENNRQDDQKDVTIEKLLNKLYVKECSRTKPHLVRIVGWTPHSSLLTSKRKTIYVESIALTVKQDEYGGEAFIDKDLQLVEYPITNNRNKKYLSCQAKYDGQWILYHNKQKYEPTTIDKTYIWSID